MCPEWRAVRGVAHKGVPLKDAVGSATEEFKEAKVADDLELLADLGADVLIMRI